MAQETQDTLETLVIKMDALRRAIDELTHTAFDEKRLLRPLELRTYEKLVLQRAQLLIQIQAVRGVPKYKPEPYKGPIY